MEQTQAQFPGLMRGLLTTSCEVWPSSIRVSEGSAHGACVISHWWHWFPGPEWRHFHPSRLLPFSPLAGLRQDDQEACGCQGSGFISMLENRHKTLQLSCGDTRHRPTGFIVAPQLDINIVVAFWLYWYLYWWLLNDGTLNELSFTPR